MEKFKLVLFSAIAFTILGLAGYWAFSTIQSGSEYSSSAKIKQLKQENEDLKKEVEELKSENRALQPKVTEPVPETNKPTEPTVYKYQSVINELEDLIAKNAFLKLKSRGPSVGTVQKFINIYNNTSNRVDNDYGEGTKQAVAAFQKDAGLTADGEAGKDTFEKMIDWLETQD